MMIGINKVRLCKTNQPKKIKGKREMMYDYLRRWGGVPAKSEELARTQ